MKIDILKLDNPKRDLQYLDGIIGLHQKNFDRAASPYLYPQNREFYEKNLEGECLNTIALANNKIVGYGALRKMNPWPNYLTRLDYPINHCALLLINLVDPDYRGRGIGNLLCKSRVEMAKNRNYQHLFATVHPENTASIKVLSQFGFKIIEQRNLFDQQLPRYVMHTELNTKDHY